MKIAIIGKSQMNGYLREQLERGDLTPVFLDDINDIKSFNGEKGRFVISTGQEQIEAGYVIVNEQIAFQNQLQHVLEQGNSVFSVVSDQQMETLYETKQTIVYIQDFPEESPDIMTSIALDRITKISKMKNQVFYLSQFMKAPGRELEALYTEARNSGVVFIKYDKLSINYHPSSGFSVQFFDGYESILINDCVLISASKLMPDKNSNQISKIFRIRLNEEGFIDKDKHFLYPVSTNRKGIYVLDNTSNLIDDDTLLSTVRYTVSEIRSEINKGQNELYAQVDAEKCAFCYTCYRICPHAAMTPDHDNSAMKNLNQGCYGCGICASVCPAGAININNTVTDNHLTSNILKVFCCENSTEIAIKNIKMQLNSFYDDIEISTVSCGGEVSAGGIISAMQRYKKVLVATCMDDACRHFEGNKRAHKQVLRAKEMLKAAGLDESRVEYIQLSHVMSRVMSECVKEALA
ncbi:MAG: hydrogenase iron-sulfur subunit [Clostridia bacterium]